MAGAQQKDDLAGSSFGGAPQLQFPPTVLVTMEDAKATAGFYPLDESKHSDAPRLECATDKTWKFTAVDRKLSFESSKWEEIADRLEAKFQQGLVLAPSEVSAGHVLATVCSRPTLKDQLKPLTGSWGAGCGPDTWSLTASRDRLRECAQQGRFTDVELVELSCLTSLLNLNCLVKVDDETWNFYPAGVELEVYLDIWQEKFDRIKERVKQGFQLSPEQISVVVLMAVVLEDHDLDDTVRKYGGAEAGSWADGCGRYLLWDRSTARKRVLQMAKQGAFVTEDPLDSMGLVERECLYSLLEYGTAFEAQYDKRKL